jgi:hypothetical protein
MQWNKPSEFGQFTHLRPIRPPETPVHPFELAVYRAIVGTGSYNGNLAPIRVASALWPETAAIQERLVGSGLLRSDPGRLFRPLVPHLGEKVIRWVSKNHPRPSGRKGRPPAISSAELLRAIALYGVQLLWECDPALALALAVDHPADANSCGGCG